MIWNHREAVAEILIDCLVEGDSRKAIEDLSNPADMLHQLSYLSDLNHIE